MLFFLFYLVSAFLSPFSPSLVTPAIPSLRHTQNRSPTKYPSSRIFLHAHRITYRDLEGFCHGVKWSRLVVSDSLRPMDCSLPGSPGPWDFPGKNTGVGCHFLLQGIFPTQISNLGPPHCRQTLYRLSHQGSPILILRLTEKGSKHRGKVLLLSLQHPISLQSRLHFTRGAWWATVHGVTKSRTQRSTHTRVFILGLTC